MQESFWINPLALFAILLLVVGAILVIRHRWYAQALLALALLGACGAAVGGVVLLTDGQEGYRTPGAILVVGALALLLGGAVVARLFLVNRPRSD